MGNRVDADAVRISRYDLARCMGVVESRLSQLKNAENFPGPITRNVFDLREVLSWMWGRAKDAHKELSMSDHEARKMKADADKKELEVLIMKGKYVDRDAAIRSVERGITEAAGTLRNLPRLIAAIVPADCRGDVERDVDGIVRSCLRSLAEGKDVSDKAVIEMEQEEQ